MMRFALLAALCGTLLGLPLCADDPPKKLTPQERKELEAKREELNAAGFKAYEAGKVNDAVKAHEEELKVARRLFPRDALTPGHASLATSLYNLAYLYQIQGKLAEAELLYKEGLELDRGLRKGDHHNVVNSLTNLARLYEAQGRLSDAEPYSKEALEMNRRLFKGDHPSVVAGLNNLGLLYQELGRLVEAEPLFKEALEMAHRLFKGDHPEVAASLNNLAMLFHAQGKLSQAEPLYKDALGMARRLYKGDHPTVAQILNNLGGMYLNQDKLAEAEPLHKEALEMRRRLYKGDHPEVSQSLHNLATLYRSQGKWADSEHLSRDALEMNRRLYKGDHPEVARSQNQLGHVYVARGKLKDAEPLFKDALEMYRRLFKGDHPDVALTLNNLAYAHVAQGKLADAERFSREALAMYRRQAEAFALQKSEGDALTFVSSTPGGCHWFLSMAFRVKGDGGRVYAQAWMDKAVVSRVFERRQQAARAVTDPKTAKLVAELGETRRRRAEALLVPESNDPTTRNQREEQIKTLEKRIAELDGELRPLFPAIERAEKLSRATVADLRKALPADAAVVDFLAYAFHEFDNSKPDGEKLKETWRYTAFVLTNNTVSWVDLDTFEKIQSAVLTWRDAITSGKEIPEAIPAKVRELVWEKVRKELPANIKTVYIAPDQALCRVPWGALPGDKPGTILLEDFAIATIPHAPFLLDKLWEQDKLKNPPAGALVVGGVNFDAEASAGPANRDLPIKPGTKAAWQALPGAAAEATGVESAAKKKGTVTALKGEAATPAAVLAALPKATHAHFATHGFFADPSFRSAFQLDEKDFERTLRGERVGRAALSPLLMTGLVFAGANNPKTPGRGIVTGEALVDLDLSGLELAVLSACETGLGDVAGGEGTFGLQRAFHLAGTRDVVASLWKVPDAPTAALMAEFYRNLWEKNLPPLAALREAQLFIYRNPGKIAELAAGFRAGFKEVKSDDSDIKPTADGKAHPRLWAAFTLSGPGR